MAFAFTRRPRDEWFILSAVNERFARFDWTFGTNPTRGGGGTLHQPVDWGGPIQETVEPIVDTWDELEALEPELFEPILETRPGLPPDAYPQPDVTAVDESDRGDQEELVAHDWGHLFRELGGSLLGLNAPEPTVLYPTPPQPGVVSPVVAGGGGDCEGMAWSGGVPPKGYKVVNYCGRGVLRKIRRRRRRRMLTASDASDLATIVGIVGKGQMASSMINRTRS